MWNNITVGTFQQLYDIIMGQNFDHELERKIKLLSCLDGNPIEFYEGLKLPRLLEQCKRVSFLSTTDIPLAETPKEINIKGNKFKVLYEFKDITGGQLIDAITCAKEKDEYIMNLDKLLAAICVPVGGKYGDMPYDDVCDLMLQLPILQANAICLFFYRVWSAFLKDIPDCLAAKRSRGENLMEMEAIMLAVAFHTDGDGLTPQLKLQRWNELH